MPGRRNSEGKGAAETGLRPRELPQAWSSATSFSHGTDGPALHPGFGSRFPGCPVQSGGGWVERGMSAAFASGLWAQCGRGARRGPSREPSHRHTTCSPSAQENPPAHSTTAASARNERHWASWLDPPVLCLLPLPQLCSLRSCLQQPEGRGASVRCFSCPSQVSLSQEIWGGIWAYPKPEQHGVPFCKPVCRWKLQCSFLLPYSEYSFCSRTHAKFHIHNGV